MMITRWRASAFTESWVDRRRSNRPSYGWSSMNAVIGLWVTVVTTTDKPWPPMFRARFAPITARPVRPKCLSSTHAV